MKIGIGIDTGGTCTDGVVYDFTAKKVLAYAKTHTTKDDLSRGIARALDRLPRDLVDQAEVIALSTTLATNACVENKGGRAKLLLFGVSPAVLQENAPKYGLNLDDSLWMMDSQTKLSGEIGNPPDWAEFQTQLKTQLAGFDAAGVVELYAKKTGAVLEQQSAKLIENNCNIPVVQGNQLFDEYNIIKRGASTMLNARLITTIEEFTQAVKRALEKLNIGVPFVIVRSDGSLMTEEFAKTHPIETLLCGPVASVMGAAELANEENALIIDMGGTTTDIALVKNGQAKQVEGGIHIGKWDTFVKGLFVDTFGLGGDSGVVIGKNNHLELETEKVMPLSMAVARYPALLAKLEKLSTKPPKLIGQRDAFFVTQRDISQKNTYTEMEQKIAAVLTQNPMSLEEAGDQLGITLMPAQIQRLIGEGVVIPCGVTPTDVMHCRGDFTKYNIPAAQLGILTLSRQLDTTPEDICQTIYDLVEKKLYCNILRILLEDSCPQLAKDGIGQQLNALIEQQYQWAKSGQKPDFFHQTVTTPAVLVGVGAPTHVFLEGVGKLLGAKVVTSEYAQVANALGSVVGRVSARKTVEITMHNDDGTYFVFGCGQRHHLDELEDAKILAKNIATQFAQEEAALRGACQDTELDIQEEEISSATQFGSVFLGYRLTATVSGQLDLKKLV